MRPSGSNQLLPSDGKAVPSPLSVDDFLIDGDFLKQDLDSLALPKALLPKISADILRLRALNVWHFHATHHLHPWYIRVMNAPNAG